MREISSQSMRRLRLSRPDFEWAVEVIQVNMAYRSEHKSARQLALCRFMLTRRAEILKSSDGQVVWT